MELAQLLLDFCSTGRAFALCFVGVCKSTDYKVGNVLASGPSSHYNSMFLPIGPRIVGGTTKESISLGANGVWKGSEHTF